MPTDTEATPNSKTRLWAGRIISAIPAVFLLVDGVMKLFKPAIVVETTVKLGSGRRHPWTRDRIARLHCPLCNSAYRNSWRDLVARLSRWRSRYTCASVRERFQSSSLSSWAY